MKAITFLGTGAYQETTYVLGDRRCQTRLFPVALCKFFAPSELLVVTTEAASAKWMGPLREALRDSATPITQINVPDGRSEEDLWTIFSRMTDHLHERDEVIFDITHSFRTLPFLSFLAAAYLRAARRVQLSGVYYGAWEAKNDQNESPVFDLTPFVRLLDWSTATEQFLRTQDGRMLGNLLNQTQQDNWKGSNHSADRPTQLKRAGKAMEEASYALELAQPHQLMDQAAAVVTCLDVAEVDVATFAKPFGVLLATVRTKYESLTHDVGEESSQQELAQQWRLLDGYFARGQSLQASTLAREWLVSLTCWQLGAKWDSRNSRYAAEGSLNRRTDRKVSLEPTEQSTDSARDHIPHIDTIVDIWGELRDLRNQIAHCGMASQDIPATTLHKNVLGLRERIRVIARSCGVISAPTT